MQRRSHAFAARLLALLATACLAAAARAEEIPSFSGMLFSRVFSDRDTQSTSRGNFIKCAPNGDIYFGSEAGLLVYDGSSWRSVVTTTPTRSKIRSLAWSEGELFASSYGSVGRLVAGEDGQLQYEPIVDPKIQYDASSFFGRIVDNGNFVHFVSPRSVVTYDRSAGTLGLESFDAWTKAAFAHEGRFFLATDAFGLLEYQNGAFAAVPGFEEFTKENCITLAAKSPSGQIAFATERGDLYRIIDYKPERAFGRFEDEDRGGLRDIEFLDDARLAVAAAGGISVIDGEGALLHRIDGSHDYHWTGARQLVVDSQGSLWAMFNSTVGKVLASSAVTQIDERMRPALFYASPYYAEGHVYARSNGQLFRSRRGARGLFEKYEPVFPDPSMAVSSLAYAPDGLYANIKESLHLLRGGRFVELGETGRIDHFETLRSDPSLIFAVDSARMRLLRRSGDSVSEAFSIPHPLGFIYRIAQADGGVFWLELGLGRVGRVSIANGQIAFRIFDASHRVPEDWVTTWEHEGRMYFPERTGIYVYDPRSDTFVADPILADSFPYGEEAFHRVVTDPRGNIWTSYGRRTYILWKQPDGSRVKDAKTLTILGELYLNNYLFLPDGQSLMLTASEMFHIDAASAARPQPPPPLTRVAEVSDIEGKRSWYLDVGSDLPIPPIELGPDQSNLLVRVANRDSAVLRPPSFQYLLEGAGDSWSKWSSSNEIHLSSLRRGSYRLRIRTLLDSGEEAPETQLAFVVVPSLYQSPAAYLAYAVLAFGGVLLGYRLFSRNLKAANLKLERMVQERTREIEAQNAELESQAEALERKNLELANQSEQLQRNARALGETLEELRSAQDQLMSTSRKAGMAEVATNVLHNVGNVLNSINVSATSIGERLKLDRAERLQKLSQLVAAQRADLPSFFASDPRGAAIPEYLGQLAQVIADDQAQLASEFHALQQNVEHVKRIIAMQQAHAKTVDVRQEIDVAELLDNAIGIIFSDVERALYRIDRSCEPELSIESDKHRILQMLTNVIKNAKDAIKHARPEGGRIEISAARDAETDFVVLSVKDNGMGIAPENLPRIFSHGFTTKRDGHGFGMHSCANAARALGGDIQVESEGEGLGATVRLRLPARSPAPAEAEPYEN